MIPIFPELRVLLLDAFTEAEPGAEFIITRYRDGKQNLRTQFERIIRRAGLDPWPKLFHNLRSSRQTELSEQFPAHVVCKWLGNTEAVAAAHYLQVTDSHFEQAIATNADSSDKAAQIPAQQASEGDGNSKKSEPCAVQNHSEKPSISQKSRNGGWPLSESNRYALAGIGF
jgi:hypothetical protein